MDIIIDIETLGTKPGCPIIEIGACAIDPDPGVIVANFSRRVLSGNGYEDVGKTMDGFLGSGWGIDEDTAVWWVSDRDRDATLRKILSGKWGHPHITTVLDSFSEWFAAHATDPKRDRIWANGPSFDIAILDHVYQEYARTRPWICWQERCVRTALEQVGYEKGSVAWEENGPRHRALNDARHEARKLWRSGALGLVSSVAMRLRQCEKADRKAVQDGQC